MIVIVQNDEEREVVKLALLYAQNYYGPLQSKVDMRKAAVLQRVIDRVDRDELVPEDER